MIMIALLRDYVLSCGLYIYINVYVCLYIYLFVCFYRLRIACRDLDLLI